MNNNRSFPWDWHHGLIPDNVVIDETAYVETTFSFSLYRSQEPVGVRIGRGASTYLGTMFDVGPTGRVILEPFALVLGARIICDSTVTIGEYALISWNVVLMDSYRVSLDLAQRRRQLEHAASRVGRFIDNEGASRQIDIGRNVWIGFDSCVLPGVAIGEGSIVGARSVVTEDVPPYTVVAGNPARVIRQISSGI
jgi:acetyltransferase-like isoleucine patch superfamily enzyme